MMVMNSNFPPWHAVMPERLWKPQEHSLSYHRNPSHLKLWLQKASVISSQHHRVQSAAATAVLILTVFIPNGLCSEFARVCMPGADRSSTWASGVCMLDNSSSVMSDSFLPSSSSQSEYIHWDLLFLWDKKLFHVQKTWGEKPLSALERKTSQDKGRSDSGKFTSC